MRRKRLLASLAAIALLVVPMSAAAAPADVDLSTTLGGFSPAVAGGPMFGSASVRNAGPGAATNVTLTVALPAGVQLAATPSGCSTTTTELRCGYASLNAGASRFVSLDVLYPVTGTYTFTAAATADQPDLDGTSASQTDVSVVDENADLEGVSRTVTLVAGEQSVASVEHLFGNAGPTPAVQSSIEGLAGGAIVPGTFSFFSGQTNLNALCTVATTSFSCGPIDGRVLAFTVRYDIAIPAVPATIVSSATITGRNDPAPDNNTSTYTTNIVAPAAELQALFPPTQPSTVNSGEPFEIRATINNTGDIDAVEVVAVLGAPEGWTAAVHAGPPEPGETCVVQASGRAVECRLDALPPAGFWALRARFTPPTGSGTGTITLTTSTPTPEYGNDPNDDTFDVTYRPPGPPRDLTVSPAGGLADGDLVTVTGVNFTPNQGVYVCQGVLTGGTPTGQSCGAPFRARNADASGGFSLEMPVQRFLLVAAVEVVDCAQPGSQCVFGASDLFAPDPGVAIEPIAFAPQAPIDTGIVGRVTGPNDEGLPGVLVSAYTPEDGLEALLTTTTDANGSYVIAGAAQGIDYRVHFAAPAGSGLVSEWFGGPFGEGTQRRDLARVIALTSDAPLGVAYSALQRGGSITGVVLDTNGDPVADASVWAYTSGDTWVGTYRARSAADGSYRLDVAFDSLVQVLFVPPANSGLVAEWYADATTRAQAQGVFVAEGSDFDADAVLARGGSISGTVVDAAGIPVPATKVSVYRTTDGIVPSHVAFTDAGGAYQAAGIAAGEVRLRFAPAAGSGLNPEWFADAPSRTSATPVVIAPGASFEADGQVGPPP